MAKDSVAWRVAAAMLERDQASSSLGMVIDDIDAGRATLSMIVRKDMLNGHGNCQGGFIFALADSAFAFACNSRDQATVAAGCSIEYLVPVSEGERLTASATERALVGRRGIYDVTVRDSAQNIVATFCGKSASIKGTVLGMSGPD